jgi:hypothetical protein
MTVRDRAKLFHLLQTLNIQLDSEKRSITRMFSHPGNLIDHTV